MRHVIFTESAGKNGEIAIEVSREPGEHQAILTVKSDISVNREIRQRPHYTGVETTDIPREVSALFDAIIEGLDRRRLHSTNLVKSNTPVMPPSETSCTASATVHVGKKIDIEFSEVLHEVVNKAMEHSAADRLRGKLGRWTDAKGGRAAGL